MSSAPQHTGHSHAHPSNQSQPAPPPCRRRHWGRRLLILVLLLVAAAAGAYFYKFGPLINSEPYKLAMDTIKHSPTVIKVLGEPIGAAEWLPRPSGEVTADGEARLMIGVAGPKGMAVASVKARRLQGKWGFNDFIVTPASGDLIDLMPEIEANTPPSELPPRFDAHAKPTQQQKDNEKPPEDVKIPLDLPDEPGGGK